MWSTSVVEAWIPTCSDTPIWCYSHLTAMKTANRSFGLPPQIAVNKPWNYVRVASVIIAGWQSQHYVTNRTYNSNIAYNCTVGFMEITWAKEEQIIHCTAWRQQGLSHRYDYQSYRKQHKGVCKQQESFFLKKLSRKSQQHSRLFCGHWNFVLNSHIQYIYIYIYIYIST